MENRGHRASLQGADAAENTGDGVFVVHSRRSVPATCRAGSITSSITAAASRSAARGHGVAIACGKTRGNAVKDCRASLSSGLIERPKDHACLPRAEEIAMVPIVASEKLKRMHVEGSKDKTVSWAGAFATCGGRYAVQSSTIVYEIEPGGHLGWHTDATEETQYIIAGTGELRMEDGTHAVGPGSVFALPANVRHDLANTGKDTLRAVAFFAAAMFTQNFDEVMLPPKSHILGTPNREG
jgi:quercetin dioxygenase-like cupin family protein